MTNGPPPIDDIFKSKMWELTEAFSAKAFTRETAKKIAIDLSEMISAMHLYFSEDNPFDVAWINDYAKIYKQLGEIEKITDEGEYLKQIFHIEMKLFALVQMKYQDIFPVTSDYVRSDVYHSLLPEEYDMEIMSEEEINEITKEMIENMNEKVSERLHNFIVNLILDDIYNNQNDIIIFVGKPGSGKSYSAISLASSIDPNFNVSRIVYSTQEFMNVFMKEETDPYTGEKIQKFLPRASAIVFDDAGLELNARDWQKEQVKLMGELSQSMRFLNHVIILTVPSQNFIEKQTRSLARFIFEAEKEHIDLDTGHTYRNTGTFKVFVQEVQRNGELLQKYPIITYNHRNVKLKYITFNLAEENLLNAYESKKKSYLFKKYSSFKQELKNENETEITLKKISKTYSDQIPALPEINEKTSEKPPETNADATQIHRIVYGNSKPIPEKKGIHLVCPSCGYSWYYTGKKTKYAFCPNCDNRVDVQKFKVVVADTDADEKKKDNIINYHGSESASFETLKKKGGKIKDANAG